MALIKANPAAEVSVAFDVVKPGTYPCRIVEVTDRNPEKNDLKVTLEYIEPSTLVNVAGEPAKNAGKLFDYVQLAEDKQWKLRTLTEACGLPWADFDPVVDLVGREVKVTIKLDTYEGTQSNKVARYVI